MKIICHEGNPDTGGILCYFRYIRNNFIRQGGGHSALKKICAHTTPDGAENNPYIHPFSLEDRGNSSHSAIVDFFIRGNNDKFHMVFYPACSFIMTEI